VPASACSGLGDDGFAAHAIEEEAADLGGCRDAGLDGWWRGWIGFAEIDFAEATLLSDAAFQFFFTAGRMFVWHLANDNTMLESATA